MRKRLVQAILFGFEILAAFLLSIEVNLFWLFGSSPSIKSLQKPSVAIASELYSKNGKLLGKFFKENRSPVSFEQISPIVINALICTEDVRFYDHFGIDPLSSLSIFYYAAKGDNRGGSTITQQLVKNIFKTRKTGSRGLLGYLPGAKQLIYKAKEYLTSLKIEWFYSKTEILTMYLNSVDFGNNTFGIKVAAKTYFNTTPLKLEPEQAALLIGMLKAPSNYNPYKNPKSALERRNVVLSQMLKYGKISQNHYDYLKTKPLGVAKQIHENIDNEGSYIRSAVYRELKDWAKENDYDLFSDGLKIYTTIDDRIQKHAEEAVAKKMELLQRRFNEHWKGQNPWRDEKGNEIPNFLESVIKRTEVYKALLKKYPNRPDSINFLLKKPKKMKVFSWQGEKEMQMSSYDSVDYYLRFLNTGLMAMDPYTGYIKAWVGGINFDYFKYDHVKQAKRQPGSTFKPFAYLAAIDNGYSPCDKFVDRPVSIKYKENGIDKVWTPHNSDWIFTGNEMSLRWAMGKSCNSITAQLTEKIGWDKVVDYAYKLGIKSPLNRVPSICLGSSDVSVFEMVGAYGTFVNNGKRCEPQLVYKIEDQNGRVIKEFKPEVKQVISEETAFLMRWMFQGGLQEPGGTSGALWEFDIFRNGNEIGGKTGTSSNHSDGWYMCLTKDLVIGCWVGAAERSIHFRTSALGEGSKTALPIVGQFLQNIYRDKNPVYTEGKFPKPKIKINKEYLCPSPRLPKDSTTIDSLANNIQLPVDSTTE